MGDGKGSRAAGAAAGCLVLWARRVRVRVRASGMCVLFLWVFLRMQVPVPRFVSCDVPGGVLELSWMRGLVSYPGWVHVTSRMCGSDCSR